LGQHRNRDVLIENVCARGVQREAVFQGHQVRFESLHESISQRQPGIVLLAVLGLLALLSIVGITFVLQAEEERAGNRDFREEVGVLAPDTRDLPAVELAGHRRKVGTCAVAFFRPGTQRP
jgi:hypothetical protein